jgi:type IV pilus assembly protein PilB
MTPARVHWLVEVARRAGLDGADELVLPAEAPVRQAWSVVLDRTGVPQEQLARLVADRFRLRVAEVAAADPNAVRLVPQALAEQYHVCPLRADYKRMVVATSDPTDMDAEQALEFASGRSVFFEIAPPAGLEDAILFVYTPEKAAVRMLERASEPGDLHETIRLVEDEVQDEQVDEGTLGSGPVVKLVNLLLQEAIELRASDLHLQPTQSGGLIRYRVDGVLRTVGTLPLPALSRVVSRVKIIGKMDISDRLRPQDGRARLTFKKRAIDLRISTVPTRNAEKAVIRFLDPKDVKGLEDVGFPPEDLERFKELVDHRDGIVVVTGPTGSGKTTTMYAALQYVAVEGINVMTVEDPVEFELPGMTQIQVETKRDVTFVSALRAILRQDPDVIFVGEIRDTETARMAVQASLTGHLVLATLHTNDAIGSIKRLTDLGIDPSAVNETFRGAVAQRLMRRPCPHCRQEVGETLSDREKELAKRYRVRPVYRAIGCEECGQTGYRGRIPIFQVMTMTAALRTLVQEGGIPDEFEAAARDGGMRTLAEAGIERVTLGETSLEELERILGEVDDHPDEVGVTAPAEGFDPQRADPPASGKKARWPEKPAPDPAVSSKAEAAGTEAPKAPAPTAGVRPGPALDGQGSLIMVVDDDPTSRVFARTLLELEGARVVEAEDGQVALGLLEGSGENPHLVILDLSMPRMDGEEFLRTLRARVAADETAVVVMTGTDDTETEIRLVEAGADDYIRKPVEPRLFMSRVNAALRRVRH